MKTSNLRRASRAKALVFSSTLALVVGSAAMAACSGSTTMTVIEAEDHDGAAADGMQRADGSASPHFDAAHNPDALGVDGSHLGDGGVGDAAHTDANMDDGSTNLDATTATDCAPATLHPVNAATDGVFCPFAGGGTATGAFCTTGQFCCKPSLSPSMGVCTDPGADGANPCAPVTDVSIQCDDSLQCNAGNGGTQCCGTGNVLQDPSCAGTGAYFSSGFTGTKCQVSCAAGQLQMCSHASGECSGGTTCTPFRAKGGQLASCL